MNIKRKINDWLFDSLVWCFGLPHIIIEGWDEVLLEEKTIHPCNRLHLKMTRKYARMMSRGMKQRRTTYFNAKIFFRKEMYTVPIEKTRTVKNDPLIEWCSERKSEGAKMLNKEAAKIWPWK